MAQLALIATAVSGGVAAYSQYQQGQAAAAEGRTARKLSEYNARVSEMQAQEAQNKALYEANLHRRRTRALIGAQRAGLAKAGLMLDTGSPLSILQETAANAETDAQMILREGIINRQSFESQAFLDRIQGRVAEAKGRNARTASLWAAGGTLLGTLGSTYYTGRQYGYFQKTPVPLSRKVAIGQQWMRM